MKLTLANITYDEQLRTIVRSEAMPGHIGLTYEREPSFFRGLEIQGTFNQIIAAEEQEQIIAFGCRSIRPMFINGRETDFGYLSSLRSSPAARQRLVLARGYRFLKQLHDDGLCPGYITTIIEGNTDAFATIASGRAGLPHYKDLGACHTYAVALKKRKRIKQLPGITVRFAQEGEEALVTDTLRRLGRHYQFFPALRKTDFGTPLLHNLSVTRFLLAEQEGTPCGIAALWNQSAFKQYRIHSYSLPMRLARPFINLGMNIAGSYPLPGVGQVLNHVYCCFKAAEDNDPLIMRTLIDHAYLHLAKAGISHMIVGFHGDDPGAIALDKLAKTVYRSRLFLVGWEDNPESGIRLDRRNPYFDPSIL